MTVRAPQGPRRRERERREDAYGVERDQRCSSGAGILTRTVRSIDVRAHPRRP